MCRYPDNPIKGFCAGSCLSRSCWLSSLRQLSIPACFPFVQAPSAHVPAALQPHQHMSQPPCSPISSPSIVM